MVKTRFSTAQLNTLSPEELLEILKGYAFLAPCNLALYTLEDGLLANTGNCARLCGSSEPLCGSNCQLILKPTPNLSVIDRQGEVARCAGGLFYFVIPFEGRKKKIHYLIGGGLRDKHVDIRELERLSRDRKINGVPILERLEKLPCADREEVGDIAARARVLLTGQKEKFYTAAYEKTMQLLNAVVEIGPELDRAPSAEAAIALAAEALTVLLDLRRIALILENEEENSYIFKGLLGIDTPATHLQKQQLDCLHRCHEQRINILSGPQLHNLLPGMSTERATFLPLDAAHQHLGTMILVDIHLPPRDLLLAELLCNRLAARLLHLRMERQSHLQRSTAKELLRMLGTLALAESKNDLFEKTLHMASQLTDATKGSLMLLDQTGKYLQVVASLGLNPRLAQTMVIPVGEGIAGRVVQNGQPLLVYDIEKDNRLKIPNRSRFKTKSFISIPLKNKGATIGVLNLSDKAKAKGFSIHDRTLLTTLAQHACPLISQADIKERARELEKLSVTDPLTGLYNRRFLVQRTEEELSRCQRKDEELSVILIDLDHFKDYNDKFGHPAGDVVLSQAANLLKHEAREMDIVTRYGGEEFCIVLPGTSQKEARLVAERMRNSVEKGFFKHQADMSKGPLTASFGVATYPKDAQSTEELISAADVALYQAKNGGRNKVCTYDAPRSSNKVITL